MAAKLAPTLWRTCRVLANEARLRVLAVVLREGPLCVSAVAARARLSEARASAALRGLQARGLLRATRSGRWVWYEARADRTVTHAGPLLAAVGGELDGGGASRRAVIRLVTAFTHPRRLRVVRHLAPGAGLRANDLARAAGMPLQALYRHLDKLARRGFVRRRGPAWCLTCPPGPLAAQLLREACRVSTGPRPPRRRPPPPSQALRRQGARPAAGRGKSGACRAG